MSFNSPSVESRPHFDSASVSRFAELVKKIGTSATTASRRRINAGRRKLKCVTKEQCRYAKDANLRAVALTLTYRDAATFAGKHVSSFLESLRRTLRAMGYCLPYAWVLERASHLHYHFLLWLPRGFKLEPSKMAKWWPWGSTWVENCRAVKAWARYMAKFDSTTSLPKAARLYGYGGLDGRGKLAVSRSTLPLWLRAMLPASHCARRRPGGGWMDTINGDVYRSPYRWTPWGAVLKGCPVNESLSSSRGSCHCRASEKERSGECAEQPRRACL